MNQEDSSSKDKALLAPPGKVIQGMEEGQGAPPATSKPRKRTFSSTDIVKKDKTGTWLSPILQPPATDGFVKSLKRAPTDKKHRHFVAALAAALEGLLLENKMHFLEPLKACFEAVRFTPFKGGSRREADVAGLKRSTKNCPVTIPQEIFKETALASIIRERNGAIVAGSLLYSWIEKGWLKQGRMKKEGFYTLQVRQHTKLEPFHENRRPVFCINMKSDDKDCLDMRVMAIVKSEMPFLESATQAFARKGDSFEGLPVIDHKGRVLIDERIVRRAAFHYANYQRTLKEAELYAESEKLSDILRHAHFLVNRAHLPELDFNSETGVFKFHAIDSSWATEEGSRNG